MGESVFNLWCANSGLVANGSKVDKTGWDFIVEDAYLPSLAGLEAHLPGLECKVQVKSTDDTKRKIQIKLSNLRRLATSHTPSFIIFIEFDGKSSAQRAYLVHIDNTLITKIVQRLHENSRSAKPKKENKTTMVINYDESHIVGDLDNPFLKSKILSYTGEDLTAYTAQKKQHLKSTGYENGGAIIKFSTEDFENLAKLIDASLGLADSVEVTSIHGVRKRFELEDNIPFIKSESAIISFQDIKPSHEGTITLIHDELTAGASLKCQLFTSQISAFSPEEFQKIRIHTKPFDISSNPHTGKSDIRINIDDDTKLEIRELKKTLKFFQAFFNSPEGKSLHINLEGTPTIKLNLVASPDDEFDYSKTINLVDNTIELLKIFDIDEEVYLSHRDVYTNRRIITSLHYLLKEDHRGFQLKFKPDKPFELDSNEATTLHFISVPIGNYVVGVFYSFTGTIAPSDEENIYIHTPTELKIERKITSLSEKDLDGELLKSELESIKLRLEALHTQLIVFSS